MTDDTFIEGPLYEKRRKVYPQSVHGPFRRIKWAILCVTLGVYYLLPFVRWNRGPGLPDQAVLIDLPHRRFYFFFIELWPQEVYYFTGLLILAAMMLFLMNAVAGRLWCGYLCPQTVWTDLFYAVERWVEGDRRERMQGDKHYWTFDHIRKVALKHFLWIMIAWWTGGAWVLYFDDAPTLVKDLATFQAPFIAYLWIGILTATTYVFAGHAREQMCIYMCPWPRIQAALTDEWALNVTYRRDRGEPRMSVKKAESARAQGGLAGDCVDCHQCINVCPTGVDIRHGIQLGCIQCGLCIDACDNVMREIGRPQGLIGYDTDINMQRRREGKPPIYRIVRPRTVIYTAAIAIVGSIMLYALATRATMDVNVLHERNPLFVQLSDGGVRNDYTVRILNKGAQRSFAIEVSGLPGATIRVAGIEAAPGAKPVVEVGQDQTREVRLSVQVGPADLPKSSRDLEVTITDTAGGGRASARDHFLPGDK
ncbi:cytochrome c oxidase accessory protein CcoG [Bradyrhizobium sp. WBOS7]|uniref:Cytochrome c oxidase accessory protein CcoG n=1 Tax=Bradyrhizobium betae TaxID=244734 RepID=A0AAE9NF33_9BRAD|nr:MULTISPECIES: cytochrome c oxidase accessory protein CcoG [Bradyrhizobium]MDD1569148.1 cytochrome c oxidase accessory protein CcoG [Bradyrhizobium sp. WBOS1]UUO37955.1 cytochrome c oxidase accessory protein CcoG [Bradyrhizobium sp. WBOS01]MDD1527077.1 cytochrome c oxidase accessory protein CcoG [Bradyrhizobium sp. WBOS2]MDD1576267.1 cytochrome c oxidase accessory protein CcoG [Bradyrhizobium sp. WBOS7]MDD1602521.1 cytochrome c oxidase accessory protein CcoG [Bradyrhizobium sp. WBOS16]